MMVRYVWTNLPLFLKLQLAVTGGPVQIGAIVQGGRAWLFSLFQLCNLRNFIWACFPTKKGQNTGNHMVFAYFYCKANSSRAGKGDWLWKHCAGERAKFLYFPCRLLILNWVPSQLLFVERHPMSNETIKSSRWVKKVPGGLQVFF